MEWPPVAVCVVTYDRPVEIRKTIRSLRVNLRYPGELHYHIADDNSPGTYLTDLDREFDGIKFTFTVTDRRGWGANVNKAMIYLWEKWSPYVFLCEDDYVAKRPIHIREGIALLENDKSLGLIRYDGLAGHGLDLQLREIVTGDGRVQCLRVMGTSPHLNLYSNRPHLKHRRFHDKIGLYPEGLPLGVTETNFAHRVKDRYGKIPDIACLEDGIERAFDHIGTTRQGTDLDPNRGVK